MKRPAERYRASAKGYQPQPREWEYPSGSLVRRLNPAGCLDWEGQRWFVCEALAGRWVRIERLDELTKKAKLESDRAEPHFPWERM